MTKKLEVTIHIRSDTYFTMSNNLPVNRDKQIREHPYLDIHKNKMKIEDINGQK